MEHNGKNGGAPPPITVRGLTMAYGDFVVMRDLNFTVEQGDIFIIMGGSGSGKSTLLRHLIGLEEAAKGEIFYGKENFTQADEEERRRILRRVGVLFQSGALWSSMTLAENIGLLLEAHTRLDPAAIREVASLKLSLVGLKGFEDYYPSEISGGMQKRAGLARAMALDPIILFFDEPSAGLDPISAHRLDELIVELRDSLGATIVIVTHEVASILAIGTNSIFLDTDTRTIIARGNPRELLARSDNSLVRAFLTRGQEPMEKR
ncbi:MAG TPA: ATP-binding cassette domain-containing protein [Candidatus Binatia bacterium]|nr:ATP-binding cassette domain-containing protein [Candidatus Binatia bacterium]